MSFKQGRGKLGETTARFALGPVIIPLKVCKSFAQGRLLNHEIGVQDTWFIYWYPPMGLSLSAGANDFYS
jgi:hypothetical protein